MKKKKNIITNVINIIINVILTLITAWICLSAGIHFRLEELWKESNKSR